MGVIIFNGISSETVGVVVETAPGHIIPERDCEITHIPGRNGDYVIDNGSYKNVSRTYQIAVGSNDKEFSELVNAVSEWLHSAVGYARLEDSYESNYYRLAVYRESASFENILQHAGRAPITFDCKPQMFLKSGSNPLTNPKTIQNPTVFTALPIITVKGSGSGVLKVGNYTVNISSISSSITIDSDIQDAYSGTTNRNADITLTNGFPKLVAGKTTISYSEGITSVEVIPRWWTI